MSHLSKKVWDNKKVTKATKMKVYKACVISILLYGSETWATNAHNKNSLRVLSYEKPQKDPWYKVAGQDD